MRNTSRSLPKVRCEELSPIEIPCLHIKHQMLVIHVGASIDCSEVYSDINNGSSVSTFSFICYADVRSNLPNMDFLS